MTHIMVDLETWGLIPGSDIRSIGAVVFDPVTGLLGDEFYVNVTGGETFGLLHDTETEKWWSEQSLDAQQALLDNPHWLTLGLEKFATWWHQHTTADVLTRFWANGPSFDEQILGACYRATDMTQPWTYRAPRDMRTICEAAGGFDLPFEGTQHDALDDARHQARCVIRSYASLGIGGVL